MTNKSTLLKKLLSTAFILFSTSLIFSQVPRRMSYQAVVRNSTNALLSNSSVGIKISIFQGSFNGTLVYSENITKTTNENGLFILEIGTGNVLSGNIDTIDWSKGIYFLTSEIDPTGGTNYTLSNSSQMMSVPYALYAEKSGTSSSSSNSIFLPGKDSDIQTVPLTNLSTSPYTIPPGKKFVTFAGALNGGQLYLGGTNYLLGPVGNESVIPQPNLQLAINNAGTVISSTNNANKLLGYLIDDASLIYSTTAYTVPAGKTLYILSASALNFNGVLLYHRINVFNGGTQPLIVSEGTVITSPFLGYLK